MPTVDATVGGTSANSYVLVAEADDYFSASFNRTLWAGSSDKEALVISASRYLDSYMEWDGSKTDSAQSMEWPREETFDKSGAAYPDDIIPMPVKFATFELAYYLLQNGGLSYESSVVEQVKVGSIAIKFDQSEKELGLPTYVTALIAHVGTPDLADSNKAHTVELERV